ncbi:MAG: hypothetical protein K0R67_3701, partial [Paenibacillus sp.]|nr:hypothetical protein [Paenibacillus sp.]
MFGPPKNRTQARIPMYDHRLQQGDPDMSSQQQSPPLARPRFVSLISGVTRRLSRYRFLLKWFILLLVLIITI